MKTVVVYESMYGNTHTIAEQIAAAARGRGDVSLVPVNQATAEVVDGADLIIVGGPTHMHGMSWSNTRRAAVSDAKKKAALDLDPDAEGPGLRDWFHRVDHVDATLSAAFDTRFDASPTLTGRASRGISKRLRHHGFREIAEPESFLIDKDNHLLAGEAERAQRWTNGLLDKLAQGVSAGTVGSGAKQVHG